MSGQGRLGLDDPRRPVPTRPTLVHAIGGGALAEPFDDLRQLAARAVHLAGDAAGLRLAERAWPCAFPGYELFNAWSLYAIALDGSETWLASLAVQQVARERLEAAIAEARAAAEQRAAA